MPGIIEIVIQDYLFNGTSIIVTKIKACKLNRLQAYL